MSALHDVGLVAIGRNEGERLRRCLEVVAERLEAIVYVDSGSSDGSVELARGLGVEVVELDLSSPFTAARARNAGCQRLTARWPQVTCVQFVDGDCELSPGWVEAARARLAAAPHLVAVAGRLRERFPRASLYNRLVDMEWNTPVGVVSACGGVAMFRLAALRAVQGFDAELICGEEPELCFRLRQRGGVVERLDLDMALHDVAMTRFGQWWRRTTRAGWAIAEGAARYGHTRERYNVRRSRSAWAWGVLVPALSCALAFPTAGIVPLLALIGYLRLLARIFAVRRARGDTASDSLLYAGFTVMGKLPEAIGQARFWLARLRGRQGTLIEYKAAPASA
jgi:glycosyltransferase involved in cell wall biosynthesis